VAGIPTPAHCKRRQYCRACAYAPGSSHGIFTSGIGTIVYTAITGVPAYMGTSFSYIAPIALVMTSSWGNQGMVGGGIIAAGLTTIVVGLLVRLIGWRWINIIMPPSILAMVVIAIGLLLAPTAWGEAAANPLLALITFALGVIFATKFRKGTIYQRPAHLTLPL
jgi:xanthine/uracil permease